MIKVEERLFASSTSSHDPLTKMAQHLLTAGGKRFRPLLVLLASRFGSTESSRPVEAGVSVELIHVGSLYHDDVIDESDTRRGAVSVNTNWSNTVAILAGDFLMSRASEVAATHLGLDSVRLLAATYAQLVEGQTRELALVDRWDHPLSEYEAVIGGKTASLIRTSARLGAWAADAPAEMVEALSIWAWELGNVFQITDDVLDLVGTVDKLGKPAGSDIREGTFTMPVLMAAQGREGGELTELLSGARPYSDEIVAEVIRLVRSGGYIADTLSYATGRLENAQTALTALSANPTRDVLSGLGDFLLQRVQSTFSQSPS